MTVTTNDGLIQMTATGGETTVDFDFLIYAKTDLTLYETDLTGAISTLVLNTDYTIADSELNDPAGGEIVLDAGQYPSGATAGHVFTVESNIPSTRSADFQQGGDFFAATLNRDIDRLTRITQQLKRDLSRSARLRIDSLLTSVTFTEDPVDGFALVWDGVNGNIANGLSLADITTATATATGAAATATTQAATATTQAGIATTQAGIATTKAAEAVAAAASIDLPTLGAAHTVLQVNTAGNDLEYALIDVNNLKSDFINDATTGTIDSADYVLFSDVTASNVTRKDTVANLLALASGGGWVPIKTVTAANDATIDFVNGTGGVVLDGTYKAYAFVLSSVIPATDSEAFWVRTSTNGGVSYDSGGSDYKSQQFHQNASGTITAAYTSGASSVILTPIDAGNDTGETLNICMFFYNPASTTLYKNMDASVVYVRDDGTLVTAKVTGYRNATTDIDAVRFLFSSGNISTGTFTLYGLASA
jgi:hypothetical protein